jgi:uncharacterized repeat protein (TIGR03803 family)
MRHLKAVIATVFVILGLLGGWTDARAEEPVIGDEVAAATAPFETLYKFNGAEWWPRGGVTLDAAGNIYGTTLYGGNCSSCGVIYKLTKPPKGSTHWVGTVLHKFVLYKDGIGPKAPLIIKGNVIYGTTYAGANTLCGCGEVFELRLSGGTWLYRVLHRFDRKDGSGPVGGLLLGPDGTLYGTTSDGGKHGAGVIYKITPSGSFAVLHDFVGPGGTGPIGELLFGKDGAIYGTTFGAGRYNQGVIFRITKAGDYKVLYNFLGVDQPGNSHDGAQPEGRLVLGPDGTIYGTTSFGGTPSGYGTAWSLKPPKTVSGNWTYEQIYIFGLAPWLPNLPHSGFVMDAKGNLYGTGAGGGTYGSGTLYKLSPPTSGKIWKMTVLHSFKPYTPGGDTPFADLILRNGVLFGTTLTGGTASNNCFAECGTVFSYH